MMHFSRLTVGVYLSAVQFSRAKLTQDTCIFVSSSDNTYDVFSLVSGSVAKKWPAEAFDFYVGLNEKIAKAPFHTISAPVSGWRTELEYQISALPEKFRYIILILDDFFFYEKVDPDELARLMDMVRGRHIHYLRLKPLERSGLGKAIVFLRCLVGGNNQDGIIRLTNDEPYYSSLQVAIWDRAHLSNMLTQSGSIWEFEHNVIAGSEHYATTRKFLRYDHLVEKGKWFKHAPETLDYCDPGSFEQRGFEQSLLKHSRIYNRIKFFLFGYAFFRLRRAKMQQNRSGSA